MRSVRSTNHQLAPHPSHTHYLFNFQRSFADGLTLSSFRGSIQVLATLDFMLLSIPVEHVLGFDHEMHSVPA
jgi:hypothetical protein